MSRIVPITTSYYDPKGLPPRCRVPQPSIFTFTTDLILKEVDPASFTLAATVGTRQYFTTAEAAGFFTPVTTTAELDNTDFTIPGFTDGSPSLDRVETSRVRETLFGMRPIGTQNVKVADPQLAKTYGNEWGDSLYIIDNQYTHTDCNTSPNEQCASEYLHQRAAELIIAGSQVYRQVPEPRVFVQVFDSHAGYIAHSTRWEHHSTRTGQDIDLHLRLIGEGFSNYNLPDSAPTCTLVSLSEAAAVVQKFIAEAQDLQGCPDVHKTIGAMSEALTGLELTIYTPEAFTPSATAFPDRAVRLARHRAGVLVSELNSHYGIEGPWRSSQITAPAEALSSWLSELQELNDFCKTQGRDLFISQEDTTQLK